MAKNCPNCGSREVGEIEGQFFYYHQEYKRKYSGNRQLNLLYCESCGNVFGERV